jgi:hypothetical protein
MTPSAVAVLINPLPKSLFTLKLCWRCDTLYITRAQTTNFQRSYKRSIQRIHMYADGCKEKDNLSSNKFNYLTLILDLLLKHPVQPTRNAKTASSASYCDLVIYCTLLLVLWAHVILADQVEHGREQTVPYQCYTHTEHTDKVNSRTA